jgi:hypothetical protein
MRRELNHSFEFFCTVNLLLAKMFFERLGQEGSWSDIFPVYKFAGLRPPASEATSNRFGKCFSSGGSSSSGGELLSDLADIFTYIPLGRVGGQGADLGNGAGIEENAFAKEALYVQTTATGDVHACFEDRRRAEMQSKNLFCTR